MDQMRILGTEPRQWSFNSQGNHCNKWFEISPVQVIL